MPHRTRRVQGYTRLFQDKITFPPPDEYRSHNRSKRSASEIGKYGSCSEDIVEEIAKHFKTFYIRANRCSSLYNDIFALRGWKKVELGGIEFELASILIEKWKGKAYRLVIQRQKRIDGELDLWEGEYTYRCILTNDYESSEKEIVEFYNLRGGKD